MFPTIRCQNQFPNKFQQPESLCIWAEKQKRRRHCLQLFLVRKPDEHQILPEIYLILIKKADGVNFKMKLTWLHQLLFVLVFLISQPLEQ